MAVVISGNGIDMGNNPVSNASQIDGVVINENGDNVATLVEANSYDIGVGQTWQDVAASRIIGVTYTNTTGKPIMVHVGGSIDEIADIYGFINGILVSKFYINNSNGTINLLVPNGNTYKFATTNGATIIMGYFWFELR